MTSNAQLSYTQSLFQQISKQYFPYSSFHNFSGLSPTQVAESLSHLSYKEAQDVIKSQCDYTYFPDTYVTGYDNSAILTRGGQFLYRADYRTSANVAFQRMTANALLRAQEQVEKVARGEANPKDIRAFDDVGRVMRNTYTIRSTAKLGGHTPFPDRDDTLYNKASARHLFGLYRFTRDEFAKLAYYVPADYLKFCSENHEALNDCFAKHLTAEQEEDHEIPSQCKSLYEDVNISCGLRRMQVVNRVLTNFDSQSQTASFNLVHRY